MNEIPVFVRPNPKGYRLHKHHWVLAVVRETGEIKSYCKECGEPKE